MVLRVVALAYLLAVVPTTATKPNIIILFGDDIGYGDLGSFGSPTDETPMLDRMAREGARMTQYYSAAAVCSPSRASLMTGRHFVRTGVYPGVFSPLSKGGLPLSEITLPQMLQSVGYTTAMMGKVRDKSRPSCHRYLNCSPPNILATHDTCCSAVASWHQ